MQFIPKYKSVQQCMANIKSLDSETAISEWFIRSLCKDNLIQYFASGNKLLINFDYLLEFLGGGSTNEE